MPPFDLPLETLRTYRPDREEPPDFDAFWSSTVFAAYNHYAGPKDIDGWTYNGHEAGGALQVERHLDTLARWAGAESADSRSEA